MEVRAHFPGRQEPLPLSLSWAEGVQPQASGEEVSLRCWRVLPGAHLGNTYPPTRVFTPNFESSLLDSRLSAPPRYGARSLSQGE